MSKTLLAKTAAFINFVLQSFIYFQNLADTQITCCISIAPDYCNGITMSELNYTDDI